MKGKTSMISNITPYSFTSAQKTSTPAKKEKQDESLTEMLKKEGIELPKLTPAQAGLGNGAFWFLAGFGCDRLLGSIIKSFKTPLKLSLAINSAIALVMGLYTYFKERKAQAADSNKNPA